MVRRSRSHLSWIVLLSVCIAAASGSLAAGQGVAIGWRQWDGPAGRITQLAAAPGDRALYAVSVTGVNRRDDRTQWFDTGRVQLADALYRSTDRGSTWAAATNDLPPGAITDVFVEPQTGDLLVGLQGRGAAAGGAGLWRQSAAGGAWQQVDLGRPDLIVRSIARTADGRSLLLGLVTAGETAANYVARSTDGSAISQTADNYLARSTDGGAISQTADNYLARSTDGGATWQTAEMPAFDVAGDPALASLTAHPAEPQRLFAALRGGALLVSPDGGATWTPLVASEAGGPLLPALLAFRPDRTDTGLAVRSTATGLALLRSSDGGLTWSQRRVAGLPAGARGQALVALDRGAYLLDTSDGTYRSTDDGASWQALEGALSSGGVAEFLALPAGNGETTVLAATGYGVFASTDGGAIWQPSSGGLPVNSTVRALLTHPARPAQVFAVSDNRLNWGAAAPPPLLVTGDGGKRWAPAAEGLPQTPLTAWAMHPTDPNRLFVASSTAVHRSVDAGVSWQTFAVPSSARSSLAVSADGARLYLSGNPPVRSRDGGSAWNALAVQPGGGAAVQMVTAFAADPVEPLQVWAGSEGGVLESRDGGETWAAAGLDARSVLWLFAVRESAAGGAAGPLRLYAGVRDDGVYRRAGSGEWQAASAGLPAGSNVLAFVAAPDGVLWLTRDGGGVYRSENWGDAWRNAGSGVGENLGQALAADYQGGGEVLLGVATAGVWAARGDTPAPAARPIAEPGAQASGAGPGVDARIEVVWPHGFAGVEQARLANVGVRLFVAGSLRPPACGWRPAVALWQATGTAPAAPVKEAVQRTVDGQPFPYWDINDVDVSAANDPNQKLYFFVKVGDIETASSVWAHAADARTHFPVQDAPSGIATGKVDAVDARIQIVWPHDERGAEQPVGAAPLANVVVAFFEHGTRLSVPPAWGAAGITLHGAWNQEVSRPLEVRPLVQVRQSGAITYPVWEFNNVPVSRARDGASRLYLWATAEGVMTYPSIWAHGADARTFFPEQDEPIQGCTP